MLIKDRTKEGFFPYCLFCSVSTKNDTEIKPQSGGLEGRDRPLLKSHDHLDDDSIPGVMGLYIIPRHETDLKRLL